MRPQPPQQRSEVGPSQAATSWCYLMAATQNESAPVRMRRTLTIRKRYPLSLYVDWASTFRWPNKPETPLSAHSIRQSERLTPGHEKQSKRALIEIEASAANVLACVDLTDECALCDA